MIPETTLPDFLKETTNISLLICEKKRDAHYLVKIMKSGKYPMEDLKELFVQYIDNILSKEFSVLPANHDNLYHMNRMFKFMGEEGHKVRYKEDDWNNLIHMNKWLLWVMLKNDLVPKNKYEFILEHIILSSSAYTLYIVREISRRMEKPIPNDFQKVYFIFDEEVSPSEIPQK